MAKREVTRKPAASSYHAELKRCHSSAYKKALRKALASTGDEGAARVAARHAAKLATTEFRKAK
eukprot:3852217-Alexandrium_andersonii.AAC.1